LKGKRAGGGELKIGENRFFPGCESEKRRKKKKTKKLDQRRGGVKAQSAGVEEGRGRESDLGPLNERNRVPSISLTCCNRIVVTTWGGRGKKRGSGGWLIRGRNLPRIISSSLLLWGK